MFVHSFICKAKTGQNIAFNFHFPSFHSRQIFVHEQYYKNVVPCQRQLYMHAASIYVMLTKINPNWKWTKMNGYNGNSSKFSYFVLHDKTVVMLAQTTTFSSLSLSLSLPRSRSHSLILPVVCSLPLPFRIPIILWTEYFAWIINTALQVEGIIKRPIQHFVKLSFNTSFISLQVSPCAH